MPIDAAPFANAWKGGVMEWLRAPTCQSLVAWLASYSHSEARMTRAFSRIAEAKASSAVEFALAPLNTISKTTARAPSDVRRWSNWECNSRGQGLSGSRTRDL